MREERSRHCCRIRRRGELKLLTHRHPQLYHLIICAARPQIRQAESVAHRQRRLRIRRQAPAEHAHKLGQPEAPQLCRLRKDVLAHHTREPRRAVEGQPAILDVREVLCDRRHHAGRPPLQPSLRSIRSTVTRQRTPSHTRCAAGARHRLLAARRCSRESHRAREERHQAIARADRAHRGQTERPAGLSEPPVVRISAEAWKSTAASVTARRPRLCVRQHEQAAATKREVQRLDARRRSPAAQLTTRMPSSTGRASQVQRASQRKITTASANARCPRLRARQHG